MIETAIKKILERKNLSMEEAQQAMSDIMSGSATQAQIGGFLTSLRMKGETVEEITGFAKAMRSKAERITPKSEPLLDTCGTGGDSSGTFNISTAAAFIVSAAGIAVAKHGNRSVSSKSGSADVLEALGVKIDIAPDKVQQCIDDIGIGFMFAQRFHGAMKYAAPVRRELGVRTVFNMLGPLTNPAGAQYQLLGVYSKELTQPVAEVLKGLGTKSAMVVHGEDGLDEITLCGKTYVSELKDGVIKNYTVSPEDLGLKIAPACDIKGADSNENAKIIFSILGGEKGAAYDITVLNAGAAIYICGSAESIKEGIDKAAALIEDGSAKRKLEQMISYTNA